MALTADGVDTPQRQIVEHAAEVASQDATPGHVFTHAWLDMHLGLGRKPAETAAFEKWRTSRLQRIEGWREEMLLRYGIHVENRPGHGYEVIDPKDTARVANRNWKREVTKVSRQSANILLHASSQGLTTEQIRERNEVLGHIGMVQQALTMSRKRPPRTPGAGPRAWEKRLTAGSAEPKSAE